jgi:hypothetical protein
MVMSFWAPIVGGIVVAVSVGFWSWLAIQVIRQGSKLVELELLVKGQERECNSRLVWLRSIENKVNITAEHTAKICGKLGIDV